MSERRSYTTIDEALSGECIPPENWDTVRQIVDAVGIASYSAVLEHGPRTRRGIFAARLGGGPVLRIESGHTIGFLSEAEARLAAPLQKAWPNTGTGSRWGVTHPVNAHRDGNGLTHLEAPRETCAECFMVKSASGSCSCE